MTRTEYLKQLEKHLRSLPKQDYIEAMDYFTEYFDEADPENEQTVMLDLGSPREAANEIISNILDKKIAETDKTTRTRAQIVWITLLAIFAAPIGIPILLAILVALFSLILLIIMLLGASLAISLTLLIIGSTFLWESITLIPTSLPVLMMGFGSGLVGIGAAILLAILTCFFIKLSYRFILFLAHKFIKRGNR